MAQLAFSAALAAVPLVFGLLFPHKQPDTIGPQIGDLSVTSSAYGTPIAEGYGTFRISGQIIWASPIGVAENQQVPASKKGGSKGSTGTVTEFFYFGNWASSFARGPAARLNRMWFNNVLVHDAISTGGIDGNGTVTFPGLVFRFYPGDQDQVADPLIEAWMAIDDKALPNKVGSFGQGGTFIDKAAEPPTVVAGSQPVSAHRGLCYIVFENVPLLKLGNRLPQVSAEISFSNANSYPYTLYVETHDPALGGDSGPGGISSPLAVDWATGFRFNAGTAGDPVLTGAIRRAPMATQEEDLVRTVNDITGGLYANGQVNAIQPGLDGFLYAIFSESGGWNARVARIDENSLTLDSISGILGGPAYPWFAGQLSGTDANGPKLYIGVSGILGSLTVLDTGQLGTVLVTLPTPLPAGVLYYSNSFGPVMGMLPAIQASAAGPGLAAGFVMDGNLNIHDFAVHIPVNPGDVLSVVTTMNQVITADDINAIMDVPVAGTPLTMYNVTNFVVDPLDGGFLFVGYITSPTLYPNADNFIAKWSQLTNQLDWATNTTAGGHSVTPGSIPAISGLQGIQSRITNGVYTWYGGGGGIGPIKYSSVNTATGVITTSSWPLTVQPPLGSVFVGQPQFYDGASDSIVTSLARLYFNRGSSAPVCVEDIIRDQCRQVGLDPNVYVDTSTLVDGNGDCLQVPGYYLGTPAAVRDNLAPLAQMFLFDVIDSDGMLKFILRSSKTASVRTLTQLDDLVPLQGQKRRDPLLEVRQQEVEIPVRISCAFYDTDTNYQQGIRLRQRSGPQIPGYATNQNPATMQSQATAQLSWPVASDATTIVRAVDAYLYSLWLARTQYPIKLHWEHLDLEPTDVVTVNMDNGSVITIRLVKVSHGADFSVEAEGPGEDPVLYASRAQGGHSFKMPITFLGGVETKLVMLPTPLMEDTDNPGATKTIMYYAASGITAGPWSGCQVYESATGASWFLVDADSIRGTFGTAGSALPDDLDPWTWDTTTVFRVSVVGGTLSSETDDAVLSGANALAVQRKSDSQWEIIQFANADLVSGSTYELSRLLRGRRGTDWVCSGHAVGDQIVLLDSAVQDFEMPLTDLNVLRHFRAVGSGGSIGGAKDVPLTDPGNDLKPYAPCHVAAATAGSDIELTWERRTRMNGSLVDLTGVVPLNEVAEAYEVDVMDVPGSGTVVRTITGVTSPSYTYAAADITADWGSPAATLVLRVYQMSAVVGRGFTVERTVTVAP